MSSKAKSIIILLLLCVLIAVIPLTMSKNKGSEFGGADGEAETAITEINPDYEAGLPPISGAHRGGETEVFCSVFRPGLVAGVFGYSARCAERNAQNTNPKQNLNLQNKDGRPFFISYIIIFPERTVYV